MLTLTLTSTLTLFLTPFNPAKSGMFIKPLTQRNVEQHLADVGLAAEYGTHFRLNALSGGQKVKVVLAAALWNQV